MLQEGAVVSIGDKADILAVAAVGGGQAVFGGDGPDLVLGQITQGEDRAGQLLLAQSVQAVALVLFGVQGFPQQVPAGVRVPVDADVVSGGNFFTAQLPCLLQQLAEF